MRRHVCVRAFLAAAVLAGWFVSSALAETRVRLLSVRETRYKDLTPEKKPVGQFVFGPSTTSELALTVELRGEEAAKATKYGLIVIKSAVDDAGKDLKDAPEGFSQDKDSFVKIDRAMMHFGMDEADIPKDSIKLDLRLGLPARSAMSLPLVEGSLKLQIGEPAKVVVGGVRKKTGQTIQDPRLAKCGVQVKIVAPKAGEGMFGMGPDDPSKAVGVQVSGKLDAVEGLSLLDGRGQELIGGQMSMGSETRKTYFLESMDPLPENVKLAIAISEGQQEVEIPFKFENVPLP